MKALLFSLLVFAIAGCAENDELHRVISDSQRADAATQSDTGAMVSALSRIARFHEDQGSGLVLQQGLSAGELERRLKGFPCEAPSELKALWAWSNGEETDRFVWYHRFLPVEEALAQYEELTSMIFLSWPKTWIPVFEFEGEWYAVECRGIPFAASPVVHFFIEDEPKVAYTNLTAYMGFMAAAMEEGALTWEAGWWREDLQRLAALHARFNPELAFPYYTGQ